MSKAKSLTTLITELQEENESLKSLKKHFNNMVRSEFGYSMTEIHDILNRHKAAEQKRQNKQFGQQQQGRASETNGVRQAAQGTESPSVVRYTE